MVEQVDYQKYIKSLLDFISERINIKPYPKIILSNKKQDKGVNIKTGYYDPLDRTIKIFIKDRHCKDCLRSFCHEIVHHHQNLENRLKSDDYNGDQITEDDKLMLLEGEAYLKGNLLFRSWTEINKF